MSASSRQASPAARERLARNRARPAKIAVSARIIRRASASRPGQSRQIAVETAAGTRLVAIDPESVASGEFAHGAQRDEPVEETARGPIGEAGAGGARGGRDGVVGEQHVDDASGPARSKAARRRGVFAHGAGKIDGVRMGLDDREPISERERTAAQLSSVGRGRLVLSLSFSPALAPAPRRSDGCRIATARSGIGRAQFIRLARACHVVFKFKNPAS